DVVRLRDSHLAITAEGNAFKAAILLYCHAWHQVPAGSLPNDDKLLAFYAGYGGNVEAWKKIREAALHGFKLHADGRLYHPVNKEKAIAAEEKRIKNRKRTEAATKARQAAKYLAVEPNDSSEWDRRITTFCETGLWPLSYGPQPGFPGCRAPDDVLVKFG